MSIDDCAGGPVRRVAGLLYAAMHHRRRGMIRPRDLPAVRTGTGPAMRVLLVGNGLAHGWGVASHHLAPTGELARAIRTITGRSCEVEFVGDAAMSAATAVPWLAGRVDTSFHAAVVAIGSNDALRLTRAEDWGSHLLDLLDALRDGLPPGAPVVLVGIPDVFVPGRVRAMNPVALHHARRLDAVAQRVAELRPQVIFLPAPRLAPLAGLRADGVLYGAFTAPIAMAVSDAVTLASALEVTPAREQGFEREEVRAVVHASRWEELHALQDVVQRAKARFRTAEAAVTLLDGDRTWHVAHNGASPFEVPRTLTYCETVVATDAPLVVEDAKQDPRFSRNEFLDVVHARSYAGVPIHAADGTPIGALCLLHSFPRSAGSVDLAALSALAEEAEAIVVAAGGIPRGEDSFV